jgi:5-methylthioadenosine/S-adenosylhomocysteine deaminase
MAKWSIQGVTVVTPEKAIEDTNVLVDGDEISGISTRPFKTDMTIQGEEYVLSPGLINAHDHLIGNYYPKVGNGPYENWLPWDNDLKSAPAYHERQHIDNRDLYLLAGYRNLLSGVTTVQDHIPHFVNEPYIDIMPLKVLTRYALAHSIGPFALQWGDIVEEHKKAVKDDMPFITHCSEGFDEDTKANVATLEHLGALSDHTVLIHGLAFSQKDRDILKHRKVNVVWCADSNIFMFNKTADVKALLDMGINVSIGTDSPMSGGIHLLYEMRFGKNYYKSHYKEALADKQIVKMVTVNPAKAFRLYHTGSIAEGNSADLVLFTRKGDPYASIVNAELKDVRLVVIDGFPMYGDELFAPLFDSLDVEYQHIMLEGTPKIIVGDLLGVLKRISHAVGFKKKFPFMPVDFSFNEES